VVNLEQTFARLRANGVRLNPEKCIFGVPRGMLLGFIISERGIEANPEKIAAITKMAQFTTSRGLTSHFISHPGERGLPRFFGAAGRPPVGDRFHPLLHGLWFRGGAPNRPGLWSAQG
jgi:hypothetical protein